MIQTVTLPTPVVARAEASPAVAATPSSLRLWMRGLPVRYRLYRVCGWSLVGAIVAAMTNRTR